MNINNINNINKMSRIKVLTANYVGTYSYKPDIEIKRYEDGKEIIVYNSPPFIGKKPENTYTIRHRYDPISYLNKSKKNVVLNHKTKTIIDSHKIKSLKNISKIFGDPFLYSLDYKSKTQKNRNKTEKNRNK